MNTYDLWSDHTSADPLPTLARMRSDAPALRLFNPYQDAPEWWVTRYDDVAALLHDPRFSRDKRKLSEQARARYFRVTELDQLDQHVLYSDPPEHTRLRSLIGKAFTPRRIADLTPRIEEAVERLLDQAEQHDTTDLLEALAFRLPLAVLTELIGIPEEDREKFREWTGILVAPADFTALARMATEFQEYLERFLAQRRTSPHPDLTSALIAAEESGERLTPAELMSMVFLLIAAGFETTGNLIGNSVWALLTHPDQLRRLRADPALTGSAVEEVLRYCPPVKNTTGAFPLEDTEFCGVTIPAEEMIVGSLLSAHHDPTHFPDPERFDITRTPNRHLAFGHGIHFCLGAALARLETTITLNALLRRYPHLTLAADPDTLRWKDGVFVRGLATLPVTWGDR
ncbi:cytochrome P450 [Streptomyces sp. NPDC044780]|uniref:cytochrome P450 family protein n=1 Tax=unclassified Streptomyces TaxID=2593676 RepID=UPI0033C6F6DF